MTKLIGILGLLLLTACGTESTKNEGSQLSATASVYTFAADYRKAKGNLIRVTFFASYGNEYTIMKTVESAKGGVKQEEYLARDIPCSINEFGAEVQTITCKKDDRPVDGFLNVIALVPSEIGKQKYDVKKFVSYYDRMNQREVKSSETIAAGLKRVKK